MSEGTTAGSDGANSSPNTPAITPKNRKLHSRRRTLPSSTPENVLPNSLSESANGIHHNSMQLYLLAFISENEEVLHTAHGGSSSEAMIQNASIFSRVVPQC